MDLKRPTLPAAILASLGLILALNLISGHGPGVSTDAVNYLSTAEHLAAGKGFENFEGDVYVLWPPLYPILLSIPRLLFNLDPLVFGGVLNAAAFAAIIFLTAALAGRILASNWILTCLAAGAVLLSTGMFSIAVNIGSDPLFIALMLAFFLFFEKYERHGDRSSFYGMIIACALASLQRYVGATLVLVGIVGIVYARREEVRRGGIEALIFAGLSTLPLTVWIARNYIVSGTPLGVRDPSTWRPDENVQDIALKASHWFVPYQLSARPIFWVALVILVLVVMILYVRRGQKPLLAGAPRPIIFVLVSFSIVYLSAMIVLTKSVDHKNIPYDDRLYLPAFFALLLISLGFVRQFVVPLLRPSNAQIGSLALAGASLLWLAFPATGVYKFWVRCINDGGIAYYNIYNLPAFRDSAVTQQLALWTTDPAVPVFSNYPAAVYLSTRRIVGSLPGRTDFFGRTTPLEGFAGVWPGPSQAVLVWYEPNRKRNLYRVEDLAELARLHPVFTSDDGSIFQVQAR